MISGEVASCAASEAAESETASDSTSRDFGGSGIGIRGGGIGTASAVVTAGSRLPLAEGGRICNGAGIGGSSSSSMESGRGLDPKPPGIFRSISSILSVLGCARSTPPNRPLLVDNADGMATLSALSLADGVIGGRRRCGGESGMAGGSGIAAAAMGIRGSECCRSWNVLPPMPFPIHLSDAACMGSLRPVLNVSTDAVGSPGYMPCRRGLRESKLDDSIDSEGS